MVEFVKNLKLLKKKLFKLKNPTLTITYCYFSQNLYQNNFKNLNFFKLFFFLRVITKNRTCYDS